MPKITFSGWTGWGSRREIPDASAPGVYLLGRFAIVPRRVDPLNANIVYIGETVGQSLIERWRQFDRSAFQEKDGHSGGWTYGDLISKKPHNLFVAAMPVVLDEPERSAFIRFAERSLIWDFVQRHGAFPKCNRK